MWLQPDGNWSWNKRQSVWGWGAGRYCWNSWRLLGHLSLFSCSFRALSCDLFAWASLGFLIVWWPQNLLAWQLSTPARMHQTARWKFHYLFLFKLSSEVMQYYFCCILLGTSETQTHPDSRDRHSTLPLDKEVPRRRCGMGDDIVVMFRKIQ